MKYFDSFDHFKSYCTTSINIIESNINAKNHSTHPYIVNIKDNADTNYNLEVSIV